MSGRWTRRGGPREWLKGWLGKGRRAGGRLRGLGQFAGGARFERDERGPALSKKNKRRGKEAGQCLGCGKTLRVRDRSCPKCGRRSPLFQPKVAAPPAFIAKSRGGNVRPIFTAKSARPVCHCGHQGRRTDRCCTRCGAPYGISRAAHEGGALKAAGIIPTGHWADQAAREADPARRELMRGMAVKSARPASAEDIARAWGFASLADAALNCSVPEASSYFQSQYYGSNGGQSA